MQLRMTVVELQQAAVTAHQLKAAKLGRQPGLQALAHAREEVGRGKLKGSPRTHGARLGNPLRVLRRRSSEFVGPSAAARANDRIIAGRAAVLLPAVAYIPTVTENEGGNRERSFDIYSRLLKDRIILIGRPMDDVVANLVVAQLIYLSADDPDKEIQIYVNSPGGSVTAGFAIYDTMQYVRSTISTVCIGRAASFGTVILMAGAKGRRFSLPSSTIHMHQPLIGGRGLQGQASDLDIHAREIVRIKGVLNELIAKHTGQPIERVERDTDRDFFLTPSEAVDYGLIDGIIETTPVAVMAGAAQAAKTA